MLGRRFHGGETRPCRGGATLLFVLLLALVGMVGPAFAAADAPALATVSAETPLLAAPAEDAPVLATVAAGTEVILTGSAAIGYLEATVDGETGWIAAQSLSVSGRDGVDLTVASEETAIRAAPVADGPVLATVPAGGVVILTGADVGPYVAGSYEGTGGWIAEADLGLPYDADHGGW